MKSFVSKLANMERVANHEFLRALAAEDFQTNGWRAVALDWMFDYDDYFEGNNEEDNNWTFDYDDYFEGNNEEDNDEDEGIGEEITTVSKAARVEAFRGELLRYIHWGKDNDHRSISSMWQMLHSIC